MQRLLPIALALAVLAAACTGSSDDGGTTTSTSAAATPNPPPTSTTIPPPPELEVPPGEAPLDPDGFYLNLMWHQHQPLYPKDEAGVVTRPWVRVHAAKDYYDMALLATEFPEIRTTFNLTPVLMLQLEELANGTKDTYWVHTEIPAAELTDEQQAFVQKRFFDVNPGVIARFPRFEELAAKRDDRLSTDELRDLQVLFNLAWTDPSFLAEEPLASLVAKERQYAEEDKTTVLRHHQRTVANVLDLHAQLWEEGRIEVTTTPLAHPILPLIADTNLAAVGDPTALLPDRPYQQPADAAEHVRLGLEEAERLLGRRPVGMWPGEGAVAQRIISLFSREDVAWIASGEDVLAPSLGLAEFERDGEDTVQEADLLYRPWHGTPQRNPEVAIFFRDRVLSDLIGFQYSGMAADAAVDDFMARLSRIKARLGEQEAEGPHVVSVILDGENAWEHYQNDGIDFLRELYGRLAEADFVRTVTPSQYLAEFADRVEPLEEVYPGAWFSSDYGTWIGEAEEKVAWDYLWQARRDLGEAQRRGEIEAGSLAQAEESLRYAEGSDWFWWYGADQDSGDDGYFDTAFRALLAEMYDALGQPRPMFVGVPIVALPAAIPEASPTELLTVSPDAVVPAEWETAGRYESAPEGSRVAVIHYGFSRDELLLRVDFTEDVLGVDELSLDVYLGGVGTDGRSAALAGTPLGFSAEAMARWQGNAPLEFVTGRPLPPLGEIDVAWSDPLPATFDGASTVLAVPLDLLPGIAPGDTVRFRVVEGDLVEELAAVPAEGPGAAVVPDIGLVDTAIEVTDPAGDDHGPGSYTYPLDGVFTPGSFDLVGFSAGTSGDDVVLTFDVAAAVLNPWGSPSGLSIQTFDVYIDEDPGSSTGPRRLIDGRNAALGAGNGWERAITIEGWEPALFTAAPDGSITESSPSLRIAAVADQGRVTVRVPRELLGEGDPAGWGYAVVVLGQEGFPSSGVRRVRDVLADAEQWRFGGAPDDVNHTRIIDVASPEAGIQEELLAGYPSVAAGDAATLVADELPQVPVLTATG